MEKIHFSTLTEFTGRNGVGKCSGVEVMPFSHEDYILLTPLTSKGEIARCDFRIPKADAIKLAEALLRASKVPTEIWTPRQPTVTTVPATEETEGAF